MAFEGTRDLNKELYQFNRIDAYGPFAKAVHLKNLHIFKQFFWIENYNVPKEKYTTCIIQHPDVWGEPINWMRAVYAIAESVEGYLKCTFWMPSEIIAFDFFLTSIIGNNIILHRVYKSSNGQRKTMNFLVEWKILKTKRNMLVFYRKNKMKIMREFYQSVGNLYWKVSFKDAKRILEERHAGNFNL